MAYMRKWACVWALVWCGGSVGAAEEIFWHEGVKLAGEIIVVPSVGAQKNSATSASENARKARAARNDPSATAPATIIIVPEEEEGVLSPPGVSAPPDNRVKAKDYSRGVNPNSSTTVLILPDGVADGTETSRGESLERNRSKARQYSDGDVDGNRGNGGKAGTIVKMGTSVGAVGSDGVIVFVCDDTNNVAGRVGDDTKSGNVFSVVINGRLTKARCK